MAPMHLAQLNVAYALEPLDSDLLADFVGALDAVNAAADRAPGFAWRLQTEDGDTTGVRVDPDPTVIVNMSVWETMEALWEFVYGSDHLAIMRRRREWFRRRPNATTVLWWIPAGTQPTVEAGMARLQKLDREGPSMAAFDFKTAFGPHGQPRAAVASVSPGSRSR